MLKAIIFDFDGTIIDTETAWYVAFREAYQKHGVELTLEMYSQCIGTSLHSFNPYEYLSTHKNIPIDLKVFKEAIKRRHGELMTQEQIRPGIMEYLNQAKAKGLKIGLASSSSLSWIDTHLTQLGIKDYFEVIRTADHVSTVKPDPELYVSAMESLGVQASEAVAIEDSPNGAKAALAAGMQCVVIPNAITKLLSFDPQLTPIESLEELPLTKLLSA